MISNILSHIVALGVSPDAGDSYNRRVRLINLICLVVILAVFAHLVITIAYGSVYLSGVQTAAILHLSLAIVLNARGHIGAARLLALIVGNMHIFTMGLLLGVDGGIYLYYPLCLLGPLFFYSKEESGYYFSFLCFTILLSILNHTISRYLPPFSDVPSDLVTIFFYLSLVGSMLTIFGFGFYLFRETAKVEENLVSVNKKLAALSETDELTKLPNIRAFRNGCQREWGAALRTGNSVAVMMIDIDDFKVLNDTYGHPVGDVCLVEVAAAIAANARQYLDHPARYGGEEFVVLMTGVTPEGAMNMGERLRQSVNDIETIKLTGDNTPLSCSIGVAIIKPTAGDSLEALIANADKALYTAKHAGKNCVKLFGA